MSRLKKFANNPEGLEITRQQTYSILEGDKEYELQLFIENSVVHMTYSPGEGFGWDLAVGNEPLDDDYYDEAEKLINDASKIVLVKLI